MTVEDICSENSHKMHETGADKCQYEPIPRVGYAHWNSNSNLACIRRCPTWDACLLAVEAGDAAGAGEAHPCTPDA